MEPWEQHHAVIKMPRFAYNPAAVLEQNDAGFLVTCTFRREKSATKEVLGLLQQYMNLAVVDGSDGHPVSRPTGNGSATGRKDDQHLEDEESGSKAESLRSCEEDIPAATALIKPAAQREIGEDVEKLVGEDSRTVLDPGRDGVRDCRCEPESVCTHSDPDKTFERSFQVTGKRLEFILIKLAAAGIIYICVPGRRSVDVLDIASRIIKDVQSGTRPAPSWCHRLLPVQATCSTKREDLQATVSQLAEDYVRRHALSEDAPVNYAVAFNKRGAATETRSSGDESLKGPTALSRDECIRIVTAAVEQAITSVRVNLTSPQMVVVVELIPVAGIQGSLACAVSILPGDLMLSKPKLNVRPLTPLNPPSKKRKHAK